MGDITNQERAGFREERLLPLVKYQAGATKPLESCHGKQLGKLLHWRKGDCGVQAAFAK